MGTQHQENFNGHTVKVIINEQAAGAWKSRAEIDLGHTGHVVFQDAEKTYPSPEEARKAAFALAAQNLERSRIGKSKS